MVSNADMFNKEKNQMLWKCCEYLAILIKMELN